MNPNIIITNGRIAVDFAPIRSPAARKPEQHVANCLKIKIIHATKLHILFRCIYYPLVNITKTG